MDLNGEDGPGSSPPPPPDDRIWRHPSELFGVGAIVDEPRRQRRQRRLGRTARSAVVVVVVAAIVGTVFIGSFPDPEPPRTQDQTGGPPLTVSDERSSRTSESTGVLEIRVRRGNRWQTASATVFPADRSYVVATGRIVDGADEIFVVVRRSDPRPAEIVGTDDHADIAVLEVGGEVGGSMRWSTPRLGSSVAVIGAPNGGEAATGTVRAIDVRESTSTGAAIDGMLLTDVQSEAELSGGAVVDDAGDVVGLVNALPFAASGHAPGTPAVRADVVALIAEQIITDGSARHAWLGVDVAEMSRPDEARGRGGVMVAAVEPRGPAATAGIAQGDWILAVEDSQVTSIPSLMAALRQRQPGDVVSLLVGRDRLERITVRLGTGPPEE